MLKTKNYLNDVIVTQFCFTKNNCLFVFLFNCLNIHAKTRIINQLKEMQYMHVWLNAKIISLFVIWNTSTCNIIIMNTKTKHLLYYDVSFLCIPNILQVHQKAQSLFSYHPRPSRSTTVFVMRMLQLTIPTRLSLRRKYWRTCTIGRPSVISIHWKLKSLYVFYSLIVWSH